MAPFKLKFRMGGSSSARRNSASGSQDHDSDPQVNEALLDQHESNTGIAASSSTIDSVDCNSLSSIGTHSERKLLLPTSSNNGQRIGKIFNIPSTIIICHLCVNVLVSSFSIAIHQIPSLLTRIHWLEAAINKVKQLFRLKCVILRKC